MKQTAGLNSHGSFVFVFSIQEWRRKVSTSVYRNFSYNTIHVFIHQKTDKQSNNCLLLSKISQSNCKWLFFAVKYETPYGGIRGSEQLRRDTIWGYPEYRASNCVRHMVSPGLDGLIAKLQLKSPDQKIFVSFLDEHLSKWYPCQWKPSLPSTDLRNCQLTFNISKFYS